MQKTYVIATLQLKGTPGITIRADELEKERDGAQQELELMREREATAELAAEAEVAFAALEAGEEAKMEAAEALAQARAEAATAARAAP